MNAPGLFLVLVLLLTGGFAPGAELPPSVRLHWLKPALPGKTTDAERGGLPLCRVYGGAALRFTLGVEAPLKTRFRVFSDLLQTTGGALAAPLRHSRPLTPELLFDDRTYRQVDCTLEALPVVERETTLLLRLQPCPAPAGPGAIACVALRVFPAEPPGGWRGTFATALAGGGLSRVAVAGRTDTLRLFLRKRGVTYDDLGENWPGQLDRCTLYLIEAPAAGPEPATTFPGARVVLFTQPSIPRPGSSGIYQFSDATGGVFCKVTLPDLLADLDTDPFAQTTFAEVLRQVSSTPRPQIPPPAIPEPFANP